MADSDLQSKLVKQLEFYFGDANLSKDRFLRQKIEESETGGIVFSLHLLLVVDLVNMMLWRRIHTGTILASALLAAIPIETVASFNRMKQLTEDMNQIRQAARTSSKLKVRARTRRALSRSSSPLVCLALNGRCFDA
jgi:hypothetical protein